MNLKKIIKTSLNETVLGSDRIPQKNLFSHLLIANKIVDIWKSFWKTRAWVPRHYSNKEKAENTIHKFPESVIFLINGIPQRQIIHPNILLEKV